MSRTAKAYTISSILLFLIASGGFIPIKVIKVATTDGVVRFARMVHDGDTIVLSHINSIYDAKVEEVLRVEGLSLRLADVKTDSYGVKEYYGITEGIKLQSWREIRLYNSGARHFTLTVNGKRLHIEKFVDSLLVIRLQKLYLYSMFVCYFF
ncbi:MAG: hypothetical protein A4E64_02540 [Syntrophorhabdus sp. PtaU1.Bin058]|nr:MAG: hypothetical protein A4E64_02540 [Syntrophorhabdus sp. PtaU1.Bin058]